MSISYPLSFPSIAYGIQRVTMRAAVSVGLSRNPFSLKTQTQEFQGDSWMIDITFPRLTRNDAEQVQCFLLKLYGPLGTFLFGDTAAATPRGAALGTPQVNGASQTGKVLLTKGWNASVTNILKAGDYFQIGNNLYKNLNDVDSDGSGHASLDIFPRLRGPYADSTSIVVNSAKGIWRLTDSTVPIYTISDAKIYDVGITAAEVVGG